MVGKTSKYLAPAGVSSTPPQHMYFLEGGLLVVSNLLKTDAWVHDDERSHCNVCVQQFMPFRRRHHCRTCGEVVCGSCSAQRKIHLTEVNVECTTRVCSFCMIRATDASINANETAMRETMAIQKRMSTVAPTPRARPSPPLAPTPPNQRAGSPPNPQQLPPFGPSSIPREQPHSMPSIPSFPRVTKQFSMISMDSELTDGSVVQLWPNPVPDDEHARLQIVRNSTIMTNEVDPTMNLLVSIVARTLECPVAFIGILDDEYLWLKASIGWDRTHIPRDDCVCAILEKTMVVADTNSDKHFLASTLGIESNPMRYYAGAPIRVMGQCIGAVCAIDIVPHATTTASMRSTMEAVANIVSEVLEQRVDNSGRVSVLCQRQHPAPPTLSRPQPPTSTTHWTDVSTSSTPPTLYKTQSMSSAGSASTLVDLNDSLRDLHAIESSSLSSLDSDEDDEDDDESEVGGHRATTASGVIHPWPPAQPTASFYGRASVTHRFSLGVPLGPLDVSEKIASAMDCFQRLQSSRWTAQSSCSTSDRIRAFELYTQQDRSYTKSHLRLAGDCTHVIAHVQHYDDPRVYEELFAHVASPRRQKLGAQTWIDFVRFQSEFQRRRQETKLLSHWRQYPDGSHVIVAFAETTNALFQEQDFVVGWFIAPCPPDKKGGGGNHVNVSCIVAQPCANNQLDERNLSRHLLASLEQSLPFHYSLDLVSSLSSTVLTSTSSLDNQISNDTCVSRANEAAALAMDLRQRCSSSASMSSVGTGSGEPLALPAPLPPTTAVSRRPVVSHLNDNERMMLELLDKTISTQEVLAAQQHVMANVMDYHGAQLQRISHAIDRVESILHTNGDKLKELHRSKSSRHSISL